MAVWIPGFKPTKRHRRLGVMVSGRAGRCAYVLGGAYPFELRGFLAKEVLMNLSAVGFSSARFRFELRRSGGGGAGVIESAIGVVVVMELSDLASRSLRVLFGVEDDSSSILLSGSLVVGAFLGLKNSSMFADLVTFDLDRALFFRAIVAFIELRTKLRQMTRVFEV